MDFLQSNAILSSSSSGSTRSSNFNNYFCDSTRFFDHTRVNITDITTTYTTPLDLRATPIPDASSMSADVQQQSVRSVFKMNPDFWQQARGPPSIPPGLNLGQPPAGGGGGGGSGGGGTPSTATGGPTPPGGGGGLNNTPNNTGVNNNQAGGGNGGGGGSTTPDSKMMTEKLVNELQVRGAQGIQFRPPSVLYLSLHIKQRLCACD